MLGAGDTEASGASEDMGNRHRMMGYSQGGCRRDEGHSQAVGPSILRLNKPFLVDRRGGGASQAGGGLRPGAVVGVVMRDVELGVGGGWRVGAGGL